MRRFLYGRLALSNLIKNRRLTLPYLLACAGTTMMLYSVVEIALNKGMLHLPGSAFVQSLMVMGQLIVSVFAVIVLFYTNGFLIKGRMRELGLYAVLGMEKRHIAQVLALETLFSGLAGVGLGLLAGMLFGKLLFLLLLRMVGKTAALPFQISLPAIVQTCVVFVVAFTLILVSNLRAVGKARPMELLQSAKAGEREPKTSWFAAILGLLSLGGGYGLALWVKSPIEAIGIFFVAVLLVILGTHLLFRAGSIALLKLLRASKSYYYKPDHFISVSGMIYRMRKNATGLANICILCTMVLVAVSTTVSLYLGVEKSLRAQFPRSVELYLYDQGPLGSVRLLAEDTARDHSVAVDQYAQGEMSRMYADLQGDTLDYDGVAATVQRCYFMPMEAYETLGGERQELQEDEVLLFRNVGAYGQDHVVIETEAFRVKEELNSFPIAQKEMQSVENTMFLVFADETAMERAFCGRDFERFIYVGFDLKGSEEDAAAFSSDFYERCQADEAIQATLISSDSVYAQRETWIATNGGFLFLGLFLGALFMLSMVLIIYYKQVSEGLEDSERFIIMQKVGMSRREVQRAINSQVVTVFFLPLAVAVLHTFVAFPVLSKMLALFFINDLWHTAFCMLGTIAAFSVLYVIAYFLTARVYYRLVTR